MSFWKNLKEENEKLKASTRRKKEARKWEEAAAAKRKFETAGEELFGTTAPTVKTPLSIRSPSVIIGIIFVAGSVATALILKQRADEQRLSENPVKVYKEKLFKTHDQMILISVIVGDVCSKHSAAWGDAAKSRFKSIDEAILESVENSAGSIKNIQDGKSIVEHMMSGLNNPPNGFQAAHSKIVSVYGQFTSLIGKAVSPSGSLVSYNQSVERISEDFLKGINELKILIPNE